MSAEAEANYSSEITTIVVNMYKKFKKEQDNNSINITLESPIERIHLYTGLPKSRILSLCDMKSLIFPSIVVDELPLNLITSITSALLQFYRNIQTPKTQEVFDIVKTTCINTPSSLEGFQNTLIALGYEYKKLYNDSHYLLVENPKITFERNLYLQKMKKLRVKTENIYYFDERIIKPLCGFKKPWSVYTDTSTSLTDGVVLFHVVSIYGLNNSIFTNNISQANVNKWISDIVIPSLKPNSVLIMENNAMHGLLLTNPITRYHTKSEMIAVLKQNHIPCTENMSKGELYELIEKSSCLKTHCSIDHILRAHGHQLMLLPTNYQKLSLTEHLWNHIKQKITPDIAKKTPIVIKNIVQSIIDDLSLNQWHLLMRNIISQEEHILTLDSRVQAALDKNYKFAIAPEEGLLNNPIYFME